MKKYILIITGLFGLFSCDYTQSLKIFMEEELVYEANKIAAKDTTIDIQDFFITYRVEKDELIGTIENIDGATTDFRSGTNVKVNLYKDGSIKVFSGIN